MFYDLDGLRRRAADLARDQFDFGGEVVHVDEWVEDGRDQLTCPVQINAHNFTRQLTLRVSFLPESEVAHHISVAERLTAL